MIQYKNMNNHSSWPSCDLDYLYNSVKVLTLESTKIEPVENLTNVLVLLAGWLSWLGWWHTSCSRRRNGLMPLPQWLKCNHDDGDKNNAFSLERGCWSPQSTRRQSSYEVGQSRQLGSGRVSVSTLTYQINIPVRLLNFEKKNLDRCFVIIFEQYKLFQFDCLDSWRSVRSKIRNQVNQIEIIFTGQK